MKICFLSYTFWPPDFGGGLLHTIERLENIVRCGNSVTACTSGAQGFPRKAMVNGIFVLRSRFNRKVNKIQKAIHQLEFFLWALLQLATQYYEVIQIGSLPGYNETTAMLCGIFFSFIAHLKKARIVHLYSLAETENNAIVFSGLKGKIKKKFFDGIDDIVVNSPALYQEMVKVFPYSVRLIINGVKDDVFLPDGEKRLEERCKNQVLNGEVVFTFLGSICRRKGVDVLLDAFLELYKVNPHWKLWLIGPYDQKENQNLDHGDSDLIDHARQCKGVVLWGRINDREKLSGLLNASDIFVFPTRREGMPMAPLQAMSVGIPIIISKIHGVTDLANIEGETGFYIRPGDKEGLKTAMLKLAEDPALRETMGRKARQRIVDQFSWRKHVDRWEQLYLGNLHE